ncbi:hypothetical protein BC831DRAFT_452538 [Entophlyctis helioformis]|nr:hypothetical protein BC831DRAFT_452538 [Entophlyctis helioformis]
MDVLLLMLLLLLLLQLVVVLHDRSLINGAIRGSGRNSGIAGRLQRSRMPFLDRRKLDDGRLDCHNADHGNAVVLELRKRPRLRLLLPDDLHSRQWAGVSLRLHGKALERGLHWRLDNGGRSGCGLAVGNNKHLLLLLVLGVGSQRKEPLFLLALAHLAPHAGTAAAQQLLEAMEHRHPKASLVSQESFG